MEIRNIESKLMLMQSVGVDCEVASQNEMSGSHFGMDSICLALLEVDAIF